jgi:hypothetical protein
VSETVKQDAVDLIVYIKAKHAFYESNPLLTPR